MRASQISNTAFLQSNRVSIEIEKKFRLTNEQRRQLPHHLRQIGATLRGEEFEENTLYRGAGLEPGSRILRLRRVGQRAILTFKERLSNATPIKHQREDETEIVNAEENSAARRRGGTSRLLDAQDRKVPHQNIGIWALAFISIQSVESILTLWIDR